MAYWSRQLKDVEVSYGQMECEAMAAVEGVQEFSTYVWEGFDLITDARASSLWMRTTTHKNTRLMKWGRLRLTSLT